MSISKKQLEGREAKLTRTRLLQGSFQSKTYRKHGIASVSPRPPWMVQGAAFEFIHHSRMSGKYGTEPLATILMNTSPLQGPLTLG